MCSRPSSYITKSITAENHVNNPLFRHFLYYAACIKQVKVLGHAYPSKVMEYVQSLHNGPILSSLQQLVWLESEACMLGTSGDITQFLHSPQLNAVTVRYNDQRHAYLAHLSSQHQSVYQASVIRMCAKVSKMCPRLRRFILNVPMFIPISLDILRNFESLDNAELRMLIGREYTF